MAKGQGGEKSDNSITETRPTRFTTLSPTIDNDHGKQTTYKPFDEMPPDPAGYLPKEK